MVAVRIIDSHLDLADIGQLTHPQLEARIDYLNTYVSQSTQTLSASYLIVSGTAYDQARTLVAGTGITFTDNGPGSTFVINSSAASVQFSWNEIPTGSIDGINRTFLFSHLPSPPQAFMLFLNGVKQRLIADFTITGSTVMFVADNVPRSGANIDATYQY